MARLDAEQKLRRRSAVTTSAFDIELREAGRLIGASRGQFNQSEKRNSLFAGRVRNKYAGPCRSTRQRRP